MESNVAFIHRLKRVWRFVSNERIDQRMVSQGVIRELIWRGKLRVLEGLVDQLSQDSALPAPPARKT